MMRIRDPLVERLEMTEAPAASLPAVVDVDRLAKMEPAIEGHRAGDEWLVNALAALGEDERTAAVLRLAERQAAVSGSILAHEHKAEERGLLNDAMLSHFWASMGGVKRVIAVKEGRRFGFAVIDRVEVWECRDRRWRGYAWQGRKRVDVVESYPHDYPIHQALRGYRIIQGVHRADRAARLLDLRLTTADHALHDLQRPGCGVRTFDRMLELYNADAVEAKARDEMARKAVAEGVERDAEKRSLRRSLGLVVGVPLGLLVLLAALF